MPELPEVETVRRTLLGALLGARLSDPVVRRRDVVVGRADARALLGGGVVRDVIRHGKQLAIVTDSGAAMCAHLGMSGRMLVERAGSAGAFAPTPAHAHLTWEVERAGGVGRTGSRTRGARGVRATTLLHFIDPRRFGGLWTFGSVEALRRERWDSLGPDALEIDDAVFVSRLGGVRRAIKAAMLDQSVIAGLGNIYTDEALHAAGIHPCANARRLGAARLTRLARESCRVLRESVDAGGSTLGDGQYVDARGDAGAFQNRHKVYARAGEECFTCGARLLHDVVAGRTTVFCARCQTRGARETRRPVSTVGGVVIHASPTM